MDGEKWLARRTRSFKASPIQKLSHLAQECNAINLAEGYPDFPAPSEVKEAATKAVQDNFNQYIHVQGVCEKVAELFEARQGIKVDAKLDITLCCGQTEAMAAAILAVVDRDDEVILLEPVYETYQSCIIMAEGKPIYVSLDPPEWTLSVTKLEQSITARTKAIIINSPHNPTGRVFNKDELLTIADICCKYDILAITDEVYEHILFDGAVHISIASFPGMHQRTIVTSSLSKTYSVTGWRVGWAIAPSQISAAIRNIHVKLTDSAPSPFQVAALTALQSHPEFYERLRQSYKERRDYTCNVVEKLGLQIPLKPQGSFFVFAKIPDNVQLNDAELVAKLILESGIAMVPGSVFFTVDNPHCLRYVRIAFCKAMSTLQAAEQALDCMTLLS